MLRSYLELVAIAVVIIVAAGLACCGGAKKSTDGPAPTTNAPNGGELTPAMLADRDQTPPFGDAALGTWLTEATYKKWHCETAPHDARSPSPHGRNRICSNTMLAQHAARTEFPVGAAGVKELYDGAGKISGYAVYLKTKAGGGDAWYWFEKAGGNVVADGQGDTGPAKSVCVGCHSGAGIDAQHSGHDFVFTQVK